MGLNERRMIKELQDKTFPERVKEIEEICGKAIPYEVDWESMSDDAEALRLVVWARHQKGAEGDDPPSGAG